MLKSTIQPFIVVCLLLISVLTYGQIVTSGALRWANGLTGPGNISNVNSDIIIRKAEKGYIINAGMFDGTIDFDPSAASLNKTTPITNAYVWKADTSGKMIWTRQFGLDTMSPTGFPQFQIATMITDEQNGDIYVIGNYADTTIDFDPGPGVYKLTPRFDDMMGMYAVCVFIVKLNSSGDFQWAKSLEIYNGGSINSGAVGPGAGEEKLLYLTGSVFPLSDQDGNLWEFDFDPGPGTAKLAPRDYNTSLTYLLCITSNGAFSWVKKLNAGIETADISGIDLVLSEDESIYIAGGFVGTYDAGAIHLESENGAVALFKYDKTGDMQWGRLSEMGSTIHGGELKYSWATVYQGLGVDKNNGVYLLANYNGPVNVDNRVPYGGAATLNIPYYPLLQTPLSVVLSKFNSNGDFKWVKMIAGGKDTVNKAYYSRLAVADDGKLYIAGYYNNSIDLDPDTSNFILNGNKTFIAQYDSSGRFMWAGKVAEGSGDADAMATGVCADNDGNVYLCGTWWAGPMDFDPGTGVFTLTPHSVDYSSAFVERIKITSLDTTPVTNIAATNLSVAATVYPNPTAGMLDLETSQALTDGAANIFSVTGQLVFSRDHLSGSRFSFDLQHMAAGIYYLELREGDRRSVFKLVKR